MILGIDCSNGLSLIFFDKRKIYYNYNNYKITNTSEILITKIENSLKKINKNYNDFSKIIIINGPGSFTGIRCSITFAKMMRISLSIPIYGYTKFELANFFLKIKSKNKNIKKRIFLHYQGENFFHSSYRMDKCISKPEILNLKQCNFNNYKNDLLISDNKLFFDYLKNEKNTRNPEMMSIFKYKLENIIDLNKQYFQKKYIPQPIYVKNLF
jgi:tRNA threonylcarbamoyl adenosine modification protein YeaZ